MATHRLIVFTEPMPGREDEYNKWYDEVHLKEVLEVDGFVAAQRFELSETQAAVGGEPAEPPSRFMAIYEIEADDAQKVLDGLGASAGTMNMSDAMNMAEAKAFAFTAIGPRVLST
ncbi:MAG: hypothetical protein CL908_09885 [Deltaproteobacteria bacterium]|jgi:hypothetical protein|nr:hypothetical protein [Deltaproteobacteria bacterium]